MNHTTGAVFGRKPGKRMLPWIMVVFAISWGLTATLIVMQDRMIDAQRDVIHLLRASQGLTVAKAQVLRPRNVRSEVVGKSPARPRPQGRASAGSTSQVSSESSSSSESRSTQVPLSQNASSETPSSQAKSQASAKSGRSSRKTAKPTPAPPPAEITDPSDMRRVLFSI